MLRTSSHGFLLAVLLLPACTTQNELTLLPRTAVGVLCVTGSEPFTNFSLQPGGGTMIAILHDTTAVFRELKNLQGRTLRVHFRSGASTSAASPIRIDYYDLVKNP